MTTSFEALVPLGWDGRTSALYLSFPAGPDESADAAPPATDGRRPGRVVRVDLDRCLVATPDGPVAATAPELPAVGDWVVLDPRPTVVPPWDVAGVLDRRSALTRRAGETAQTGQVMASNVDLVAVVVSLDRPLNVRRLERELVLAWDSGAQPMIVLNKADVHPDPAGVQRLVRSRVPRVEVVVTSTVTGAGIDVLTAAMRPHRTMVLLGASGVGKSSLVNRLAEKEVLLTGEVRAGDHKGRHTTSARHLIVLAGGGVLIDTPGVRGLGLWDAADAVAMAYADIEKLAAGCRFNDCRHAGEPGCAVAEAVVGGRLEPGRLAHYAKLAKEASHNERRGDPKKEARKRRHDRSVQLAYRRSVKAKKRAR